MRLTEAEKLAMRVVELLAPHCDRIDIAGSIRRKVWMVKDIEVVCLPKREFIQKTLFGDGEWLVIQPFEEAVASMSQRIVKGQIGGRYMQIELKGGAFLDLFMPAAEDYFRQLAIRTGSAQFARDIIAAGWRRKGWCGTSNAGLRKMQDCSESANGWVCVRLEGDKPPAWQSEEEFFEWLGIPFTEPMNRY